jgi:NAD(P)-dependent dehydrogenase (short-subunit alcohol dehydrogenase family)
LTVIGIGRAVALSFAAEGCTRIAIADVNLAGLQETTSLISKAYPDTQVLPIEVNLLDEDSVVNFVSGTVKKFGSIDYAVNCAGVIGNGKPSHETSVKQFDTIMGVNVRGLWLSSREEIKAMLGQEIGKTHDGRRGVRGAVVNIASQLGIVARPDAREFVIRLPMAVL